MSVVSSIEWTDTTWNPVRGCSRVSEGCRNCYAERQAARFSGSGQPFAGFAVRGRIAISTSNPENVGKKYTRWTGEVELIPSKLDEPLHWRKPRRVFVNSMSDLFHEALSDESIAAVFGVMAACPQHTFQVLTKRPKRMRQWFEWATECSLELEASIGEKPPSGRGEATVCTVYYDSALGGRPDSRLFVDRLVRTRSCGWPIPNVWLGVSVEDQATFDARVLDLVSTPAALRFISYEPALGPLDCSLPVAPMATPILRPRDPVRGPGCVHWLIVGGESGPGARPCDLAWIRSAVKQGKEARAPVFVKQLGAWPFSETGDIWPTSVRFVEGSPSIGVKLRDRKGGDPSEWPEDLRVREFPEEGR